MERPFNGPLFAQQVTKGFTVETRMRTPKTLQKFDLEVSADQPNVERVFPNTNKMLQKLDSMIMNPDTKSNLSQRMARGGADPGGGGMVRAGNQVKTMAEAGLVLERSKKLVESEFEDYYEISSELKTSLKEIIERIPLLESRFREDLYANILERRDTFIKLKKVDASLYKQIRSDYAAIIHKHGQKLDSSSFVLPAFSMGAKTYIIDDVFDHELSTQQRAFILIHEYNMRTKSHLAVPERLELSLQMDAQIFKLVTVSSDEMTALNLMQTMTNLAARSKSSSWEDRVSSREFIQNMMIKARLRNLQKENVPVLLSTILTEPRELLTPASSNGYVPSNLSLIKRNLESRSNGITDALRNSYWIASEFPAVISKYNRVDSTDRVEMNKVLGLDGSVIGYCQKYDEALRKADASENGLIFVGSKNIFVVYCLANFQSSGHVQVNLNFNQ